MMRIKHMLQLMVCCLLCLATIGCISAKYVEQKQYLLNIKILPEKKMVPGKCSVFVDYATAIPPFDQLDFLYRVKSGQYLTDYYHGFLVSPTEQIGPVFTNYLKALGDFNLDASSILTAQNKIKVQLTEFYADYRDHDHPKAVVALRFILTGWVGDKTVILLDKVLHARVALKEKDTNSLLVAWNSGLQDVLRRGIRILNEALLENPCIKSAVEVSDSSSKETKNVIKGKEKH